MPRPRFTVRRMMLAVAIAAASLGYARFVRDRYFAILLDASTPLGAQGFSLKRHIRGQLVYHYLALYVLLPCGLIYLGYVAAWRLGKRRESGRRMD